jgi:hypothetical protein
LTPPIGLNLFMARFFSRGITIETHIELLQSVYVLGHNDVFWELYWLHFKKLFLDLNNAPKSMELLSFWFDESLPVLRDHPYLAPAFFLQLPGRLDETRTDKLFKRVVQVFESRSMKYPWYPIIRPYLSDTDKKGKLLSFLRR